MTALSDGASSGGGDNSDSGGSIPCTQFIPIEGRSFAIQETEVTRGQWKSVMGRYPEDRPEWHDCDLKEKTVFEDDHPVSCVSCREISDFAREMNAKCDGYAYRLPSEEEWAYAADGSTVGHCGANSTRRVGGTPGAHHNGLYDMADSVMEWTSTSDGVSDYISRGGGCT